MRISGRKQLPPALDSGSPASAGDIDRRHDSGRRLRGNGHVARTRYIFARCSPDIDVQVIPVDEHLRFEGWVHQFAYQSGAFVKAIATPYGSDDE